MTIDEVEIGYSKSILFFASFGKASTEKIKKALAKKISAKAKVLNCLFIFIMYS